MTTQELDELLEKLEHHPLPEIELSLDRITGFLERVGDPHLHMPPVIHVAGTNGKGSVIAYMQAMLEAAGYRVHAYTSPHLVRFNERIVVRGQMISDDALIGYLREVVAQCEDYPLTYFESTTVAALMAFAASPADVVLLETGMGGRFDATNIFKKPLVTVITPVSFDHMQFLGETLSAIAYEKAGIMKPYVPCVIGQQPAEALTALKKQAEITASPLSVCGEDWYMEGDAYHSAAHRYEHLMPALPGAHQLENAGLAIAALEQAEGLSIPAGAVYEGIGNARWRARLQHLTQGPLVEALPNDTMLWLDGGHNPSAGQAIAAWCMAEGKTPYLCMAMLNDKDAEGYLRPLVPHLSGLVVMPVPGEAKSHTAEHLAAVAKGLGLAVQQAATPQEAIALLGETPVPPTDVLIGGSLYLAGQVLANHSSS